MTFPAGIWGSVNLAIFTYPSPQHIYVARCDLGVHLKDPSMTLNDFQRIFRSCDNIKNSMWSKFMVVEVDLPFPLETSHKPAHQQEGWAGAHIYTLVTLGGLAAIFSGKAGAQHKLPTLFPSASKEYLNQCAQACLDKHNELTGQSINMNDLEALAYQDTPPGEHEHEQAKASPPVKGRGKSITRRRKKKKEDTAEQQVKPDEDVALQQEERTLAAKVDDLRASYHGFKKLLADVKAGLIAVIPFVLTDELQNQKRYSVEIDLTGVVRRVPFEEDENPFACLDDDEIAYLNAL